MPWGCVLKVGFWLLTFLFLLAAAAAWAILRPTLYSRRVERALQAFVRNQKKLEDDFFQAAASSGKPRGLEWTQCAFQQGVLLARDRANGQLVGLRGVTIGFKAIEGGGMEDVEAVSNLRAATAIFTHDGRGWSTQGRVAFNLEPREVIERYKDSLDAVQ